MTDHELALKSIRYRRDLLRFIYHAGAGHTGGSLSCVDILNVLYNRVLRVSPATFADPRRDRYIQSKGHSVEALYVVLADRGFFPQAELDTLCRYKSPFVGHPTRKVPGIEMNTGALGHGLSISVGMALAAKLDNASYRVFTLLGDGELAEGSNWEGAMAAAHYNLDNLTAILDHNTLQITGRTRDVCSNEPIDEKFRAFGWTVRTANGHDFSQMTDALTSAPEINKPTLVIANTTKGRGVSFMEDVVKWHHGVPSNEEMDKAVRELDAAELAMLRQSMAEKETSTRLWKMPNIAVQPLDMEPAHAHLYPDFVIGELLKRGIGRIEADRAMEHDGKVDFVFTDKQGRTEVISRLDALLFRSALARFGPRCDRSDILYGGHTLFECDYFREGALRSHLFSMYVCNLRNCGFWLRLYLYQIDDNTRPVFEPIQ